MPLARSVPFRVLINPSLCRLQDVSEPRLVGFFPYPDKLLPLLSPVCECVSLGRCLSVY